MTNYSSEEIFLQEDPTDWVNPAGHPSLGLSFKVRNGIGYMQATNFVNHYAKVFSLRLLCDMEKVVLLMNRIFWCTNFDAEEPFWAAFFFFDMGIKPVGLKAKGETGLAPVLTVFYSTGTVYAHTAFATMYRQLSLDKSNMHAMTRGYCWWLKERAIEGVDFLSCLCGERLEVWDDVRSKRADKDRCPCLERGCLFHVHARCTGYLPAVRRL